MQNKIDLSTLSTEVTGISMLITGLSNQLDDGQSDSLTAKSLREALFGVSMHLDRISDDLYGFSEKYDLVEV